MNSNKLLNKIKQCLCPPGEGVYTVNTAKARKSTLQKEIYGHVDNVEKSWLHSLENMQDDHRSLLLGICSDTGGGILRGANWGPLFVREALLNKYPEAEYLDIGDIRVIPHFHHDKYLNIETIESCREALYGNRATTLPVSALSITENVLNDVYAQSPERRIFAIGGDHSVSYPLTKAYLLAKRAAGKKVSIIHFDAHTDLLSTRLGVDICFGSWCTHIIEYLHDPSYLIQLGIRSSGKDKHHWESTYGVQQFWADEIKAQSSDVIANRIGVFLKREGIDELYISFDIDAIDDAYVSATGTPEPNGLLPQDALNIIHRLSACHPITGADIVEVAPFLKTEHDQDGGGIDRTLSVAADISFCLLEAMKTV